MICNNYSIFFNLPLLTISYTVMNNTPLVTLTYFNNFIITYFIALSQKLLEKKNRKEMRKVSRHCKMIFSLICCERQLVEALISYDNGGVKNLA